MEPFCKLFSDLDPFVELYGLIFQLSRDMSGVVEGDEIRVSGSLVVSQSSVAILHDLSRNWTLKGQHEMSSYWEKRTGPWTNLKIAVVSVYVEPHALFVAQLFGLRSIGFLVGRLQSRCWECEISLETTCWCCWRGTRWCDRSWRGFRQRYRPCDGA